MNRKLWLTCLGLVLLALAMAFAACGDDDDDGGDGTATATATAGGDDEAQEVADVMERLASISGSEATDDEKDFYIAHITDAFLQGFGTESIAACEADIVSCIGDPLPNASVNKDDVDVDGDTARLVIQSDIGQFGVTMAKEGGVWKADGQFVADDVIPDGVEVVEFEMAEFAFPSDLDNEAITSGDFALHAVNIGQQTHEIILAPLPAEGELEELLASDTFNPDPVFVKVPYQPGDESDIALPSPLEPGRYAFICFLPDTDDPDMTPHAFKGMAREFTVE